MKRYLKLHDKWLRLPRQENLIRHISALLPSSPTTLLDIGSGDGRLAAALQTRHPNLTITAVDNAPPPVTAIPTLSYDGVRLPLEDNIIDHVMLIDVLHHADNIPHLLSEAVRVARQSIIIKDHYCENVFDYARLWLTEHSRNFHVGMAMPLNYVSENGFKSITGELRLTPLHHQTHIDIFNKPIDYLFGGHLNFISQFRVFQ
jgi:SAM-dependent methyltransferase